MTLPLAYLDVVAIEEVPVEVWTEVFEVAGWPTSLVEKKNSIAHADIIEALRVDPPSDELLHALETLHEFGSEAGRDAIVTAMRAFFRVDGGTWPVRCRTSAFSYLRADVTYA